jgi:hypothetical protein
MESVSLKKPSETPSDGGTSNITGFSASEEEVSNDDNSPAELSVKS